MTYLKVQLLTKVKQFSVHLYMYAAVINHQLLYLPQTLFHGLTFSQFWTVVCISLNYYSLLTLQYLTKRILTNCGSCRSFSVSVRIAISLCFAQFRFYYYYCFIFPRNRICQFPRSISVT